MGGVGSGGGDLVFNGAAVGLGGWGGDRFSGQGGVEGEADIVFRLGDVGRVGGVRTIDRTCVDNFCVGVQDIHLGGGLGFELLAHFTGGIEEDGGGRGFFVLGIGFGLGASAVALFARGGGDDGEPNDSLGGVLLLELLHVSA